MSGEKFDGVWCSTKGEAACAKRRLPRRELMGTEVIHVIDQTKARAYTVKVCIRNGCTMLVSANDTGNTVVKENRQGRVGVGTFRKCEVVLKEGVCEPAGLIDLFDTGG